MRKLASIQKIVNIFPIPNADLLVLAQVNDWLSIVKKGEFQVGELVVYCEIDSVLPEIPAFEFMRQRDYRVNTIKLRGTLSQGLIVGTSVLPEGTAIIEDFDVSSILGVVKPIPGKSRKGTRQPNRQGRRSNFPNFIKKTDETRIQSKSSVLDELEGVEVYAAVKMDGQSLTFANYAAKEEDNPFIVCSRNFKKDRTIIVKSRDENVPDREEIDTHWQIADRLKIFENLPYGFAMQGEYLSDKIQGNHLGVKEPEWHCFQVFDIVSQKYLDYANFVQFCLTMNIKTVPIERVWKFCKQEFIDLHAKTYPDSLCQSAVGGLLQFARGRYSSGFPREGLVIRPTTEQYSESLKGRASFKVINNDFLLKVKGKEDIYDEDGDDEQTITSD
jgi:RNA ligase (TIGR02306 family)